VLVDTDEDDPEKEDEADLEPLVAFRLVLMSPSSTVVKRSPRGQIGTTILPKSAHELGVGCLQHLLWQSSLPLHAVGVLLFTTSGMTNLP